MDKLIVHHLVQVLVFHFLVIDEAIIQVIESIVKILVFPRLFCVFWRLLTRVGHRLSCRCFSLLLFLFESLGLMAAIFLNRSESVIVLDSSNHRLDQCVKPILPVHSVISIPFTHIFPIQDRRRSSLLLIGIFLLGLILLNLLHFFFALQLLGLFGVDEIVVSKILLVLVVVGKDEGFVRAFVG